MVIQGQSRPQKPSSKLPLISFAASRAALKPLHNHLALRHRQTPKEQNRTMSNINNVARSPTNSDSFHGRMSVETMGTASSNASITAPPLTQTPPRTEHSRDLSAIHDPELANLPANHITNQTQNESTTSENRLQSSLSLVQSQATDEILRTGPSYDELLEVALSYPVWKRKSFFEEWKCFDAQGRLRKPWRDVDELTARVAKEKEERTQRQAKEKEDVPINGPQTPRQSPNSPQPLQSNSHKASRHSAVVQVAQTMDQCLNCQLDSDFGDGRPKRRCSSCAKLSASTPSKASKNYGAQSNKRLKTGANTKQGYIEGYALQPTDGAPVSGDQQLSRHKRSAGPGPPSPALTSLNHENALSLQTPDITQSNRRASRTKLKINILQSGRNSAALSLHGTADGIGSETTRSNSRTRATSIASLPTQHALDNLQTCKTCNMPECTCILARLSSQTITCSEHACSTHLFNAASLQRIHGIRLLEEAQEQLSKTGSWSCPECTQKNNSPQPEPVSAGPYSIQSPVHGDSFLSQDEIRRPLNELSGKISQYIHMAFTQPTPYPLVPFTEIPCIRHESSTNPLVPALRRLLNLGDGISIRAKIEGFHMGPEENAIWIKGILMLLVCDFIFDSGSPFEDTPEMTESLSYLIQPNLLESIIQDSRIRVMSKKPENAQHFTQRRTLRHDDFVKQLNSTMHSLVGCNDETKRFHSDISRIAAGLNEKIFAYQVKGVHEPIIAKTGDAFDPEHHELDSPELGVAGINQRDLKGKTILLTTIVGVKFKARGEEGWVVCSPAKVRLWRNAVSTNQSMVTPKAILPPRKGKN